MADSNLNVPVIIQATRLDTSVLPRNIFSQSYLLYVIAQGTDVGNVANKANEAGQGAYDAQVRNDEQDVILADHEQRISAAEATLVNHEERISQAESTLSCHKWQHVNHSVKWCGVYCHNHQDNRGAVMIQFKPTRNIDLIEAVGNHPDIIAGSNNGDGYDYKPECRYFEVNVHGQFGGIVYYQEIQPLTFDCHAMYLPEIRGFSKEIGLEFWRYILTNTTVQCVTSFAARKFRHGQMYCAMIGLKRVGTIKKYFKGVDDVTFYSATREELIDFLNHGR
ncbi:hypothetical protein VEE26_04700 [Escherichia coli]|nr:hypothetical protein VEE26_04700 [Escherichia coli]